MSTDPTERERHAARALFYVTPRTAELRPVDVSFMAEQENGEHVLVRTLWSAISRGTERLVFEGAIPESEYSRMRAPYQGGDFPFPVKYGYACAGTVEDGPADLLGRHVFALHPHQTKFMLPRAAVALLPAHVPVRRAILAANMETALNAIWDSGAGPGDRIVIVGAGALGLLIASLITRIPGSDVTVCDIDPSREAAARSFGAAFGLPEALGGVEADVVFHTSATASGLAASLDAAGFEGTIVEVSWFGAKEVAVSLGKAFHSKRLKFVSSQVGAVAASRRPRWLHARRLAKAIELLGDSRLDALITDEVPFDVLPERMASIFAPNSPGIVTAVQY